jgi:hypothetical protein
MSDFNKTKVCPFGNVLDGAKCNDTDCRLECEPKLGGKRWK